MLYLSFCYEGFEKRFPLVPSKISIGRSVENDLIINEAFFSRVHLTAEVMKDCIIITDHNSANGTYVDGSPVSTAKLIPGDHFEVGEIKFTLKQGLTDDFSKSNLLEDYGHDRKKPSSRPKMFLTTLQVQNAYRQMLESYLTEGLKLKNFPGSLHFLSKTLGSLPGFGSFFLVSHIKQDISVVFSVSKQGNDLITLKEILNLPSNDSGNPVFFQKHIAHGFYYSFLPVKINTDPGALIYFHKTGSKTLDSSMKHFLLSLSKEIELLSGLFPQTETANAVTINETHPEIELITENPKMKTLVKQAKKIASSDIYVLIEGESGTGKELIAKILHHYSKRGEKHYVAINCAAIPPHLLESELFGHEKGAFTGAVSQKKGKLELASGGTLVLDEIGDMPGELQAKILRAIQENEFYRVGGTTPIQVDLRILSLTHQDLRAHIEKGTFREDLYFRLVHRKLSIPPLRKRREDIPVLINFFSGKYCRELHKSIDGFSIKAMERLQAYDWPGNVRQLENEIHSIISLIDDRGMVQTEMLSETISKQLPERVPGQTSYYQKPDKTLIAATLEDYNGNKTHAAKALNMTYRGLHKRMVKLGMIE